MHTSLIDRIRRVAPVAALGWTALALVLLLMPSSGAPSLAIPHADKLIHVVLFAVGTRLWMLVWPRSWVAILIGAAALAIGTEVAQGALGWGRSAELADACADGIGALLGVLGARPVEKRCEKQGASMDSRVKESGGSL